MDATKHTFDFQLERLQVDEIISSLIHTILYCRSKGKFEYDEIDGALRMKAVYFECVPCKSIDFHYRRLASEELVQNVNKEIKSFSDMVNNPGCATGGEISLMFYHKKKCRFWQYESEILPWEIWTLKVKLIYLKDLFAQNDHEIKMGEQLKENVHYISTVMEQPHFVPPTPAAEDLDSVFDTSYSDIQPYLFKITQDTSAPSLSRWEQIAKWLWGGW